MHNRELRPSSEFTERVMKGVKSRPRKIGLWNIAYFIPLIIVIAILLIPKTREMAVNIVEPSKSTIYEVQNQVDSMQTIVDNLDNFSDNSLNQIDIAKYEL